MMKIRYQYDSLCAYILVCIHTIYTSAHGVVTSKKAALLFEGTASIEVSPSVFTRVSGPRYLDL